MRERSEIYIYIYNRSYILASHKHLPVHMDLPTAETSVQLSGQYLGSLRSHEWCSRKVKGCGLPTLHHICRIDPKVNDALTFEQSDFSEIHEQYHDWTAEIYTQATRAVTDTQTNYCSPLAHAQMVNNDPTQLPRSLSCPFLSPLPC